MRNEDSLELDVSFEANPLHECELLHPIFRVGAAPVASMVGMRPITYDLNTVGYWLRQDANHQLLLRHALEDRVAAGEALLEGWAERIRPPPQELLDLVRVPRHLEEPLYIFGDDAKDYFNQLAIASEDWWKFGVVFIHADEVTAPRSAGERLFFVSERRLGFGARPSSNIAQRFSEALLHLLREDMDAYVALPLEWLVYLHITVLELLASGVGAITLAPYLRHAERIRLQSDALATPFVLSRHRARSPMLQFAHHQLLKDPRYEEVADNADIQHLDGDDNPFSDSVSRALWPRFQLLCRAANIQPVHVPRCRCRRTP